MRQLRMSYFNGSLLFLAVFFFGCAIFTYSPAVLMQRAQDMLAAVGVSASIAPNPYNTMAQQLAEKEARLNNREADIAAKEQAVAALPSSKYGFYSLCISAVLFVLLSVNFYLDVRRRHSGAGGITAGAR